MDQKWTLVLTPPCHPRSGLDSTTALQLVESLRALASGGRAIITTIHQPSSRLYQLLDKLMLLCDGHVMYYGKVCLDGVPPQGSAALLWAGATSSVTWRHPREASRTFLCQHSSQFARNGCMFGFIRRT